MKIVPITSVKPLKNCVIADLDIKNSPQELKKGLTRLQEIGFVPGNNIQLQGKNGSLYNLKIGDGNPFVIDKNFANKIMVRADDSDVFDPLEKPQKQSGILDSVKNLFKK